MEFAVLVFVLMLGGIFGGYWLFVVRPETMDDRALRTRLKAGRRRVAATPRVVKTPKALSTIGPLATLLAGEHALTTKLRRVTSESATNVTLGTVLLGSVFLGFLAAAGMWQVTSALWACAAAFLFAASLPVAFLRYKARKRMAVFEEQFPEAIDLLARALRAGHALTTALQMAADELPDPVGGEFKRLFEEQNYGMSLPDALRAFAERVNLLDARFFATAVLTQRETGGNLSEIFDNLSSVIRERFRVKRQVRVISAHGRITGFVLGLLPLAVAGALLLISPAHIQLLFKDPLGVNMVMIGVVLQVIGILAIRHIVNVEY